MNEKAKKHTPKTKILQVSISRDGRNLYFYESCTKGMIEKIVKKLKKDYGFELKERCRSMCG